MGEWTLFTNHGLVLVYIAKNPENTASEIGNDIGLTERTVHRIIINLEEAGYITRIKIGRHNTYRVHPGMIIQDPVTDTSIGELLATLGWKRKRRKSNI